MIIPYRHFKAKQQKQVRVMIHTTMYNFRLCCFCKYTFCAFQRRYVKISKIISLYMQLNSRRNVTIYISYNFIRLLIFRLHGGYGFISSGDAIEALLPLTGGLSEHIRVRQVGVPGVREIIRRGIDTRSVLTASLLVKTKYY